jgi:hypothetical protein
MCEWQRGFAGANGHQTAQQPALAVDRAVRVTAVLALQLSETSPMTTDVVLLHRQRRIQSC